jgi:hypothetical protein
MIESLIAGRPFLYQTRDRAVYHVSQKGVEAIQPESSWLPETHIMAFVDGDGGTTKPDGILIDPLVQIVIATSPKGANQKWIQQGVYTRFTKLATSLWTPRELFLTGYVLTFHLSTLD